MYSFDKKSKNKNLNSSNESNDKLNSKENKDSTNNLGSKNLKLVLKKTSPTKDAWSIKSIY